MKISRPNWRREMCSGTSCTKQWMQSVYFCFILLLHWEELIIKLTCIAKPLQERIKDTPAQLERKITEIEDREKAFEKKNEPRKRAFSKVVQDFLDWLGCPFPMACCTPLFCSLAVSLGGCFNSDWSTSRCYPTALILSLDSACYS